MVVLCYLFQKFSYRILTTLWKYRQGGKLPKLYELLGLMKEKHAKEDVEKAFMRLMLLIHLDRNPNEPSAAEMFSLLQRIKKEL